MKPLAYALIPALAFAAPPAHAFCRTTTTQIPAGYDPVAEGCWTQGKPLGWHASRAPYGVSKAASNQVSLAEATRVADLAFDAWNTISCPSGTPAIQAYDDGPSSTSPDGSDCASGSQCNPTTHDVIVFDDTVWPHDDKANTLALTTVTYGVDDGTIFEAYTEVDAVPPHEITTQEPPPAGSSAYDLQAILTHEAGHFFGLAHATETSSVMYAYYLPGKVHLTSDDEAGFCAIYPHASSSSGGCATPARASLSEAPAAIPCVLVAGLALVGVRRARHARPRRRRQRLG